MTSPRCYQSTPHHSCRPMPIARRASSSVRNEGALSRGGGRRLAQSPAGSEAAFCCVARTPARHAPAPANGAVTLRSDGPPTRVWTRRTAWGVLTRTFTRAAARTRRLLRAHPPAPNVSFTSPCVFFFFCRCSLHHFLLTKNNCDFLNNYCLQET